MASVSRQGVSPGGPQQPGFGAKDVTTWAGLGCDSAELEQQEVQRDEGAERIGERSVKGMDDVIRTAKQEGKIGKSRLGSRKDWTVESEDLMALEVWIKSEDKGGRNE